MGTNSHLIVEEYQPSIIDPVAAPLARTFLLPLSARSANALDALLQQYESFAPWEAGGHVLYNVCRTASLHRKHDEYRAAILCDSIVAMQAAAAAARRDESFSGVNAVPAKSGPRRIVFIAPGQGSQWAGMARELFAEQPVFRSRLEECDRAIKSQTGWSLIQILLEPTVEDALQQIDIVQPALFALSVSLAALWRSWGVAPDAVVGHSMGEVAAACIAGVLSLEDAARVICLRSRLMKSIRGAGAMLTVDMPLKAVKLLLNGFEGEVSIAASNSPGTTVLSGETSAIARIETTLAQREIFCRRVKVDVASHSSQVDPILTGLREGLSMLKPNPASVSLLSTVTGEYLVGTEMAAEYWVDNLRQPVHYADAIETLARDGYDVFVELSPHPILTTATEDTLKGMDMSGVAVGSGRRNQPEMREIFGALGTLYRYGCDIAWDAVYPGVAHRIALPEYPFQRERCWPDLQELQASLASPKSKSRAGHPLLAERFESSLQPDAITWKLDLELETKPFLRHHQVHGTIVLPAAAQIELVLEAMRAEAPGSSLSLFNVHFESAMQIAESTPREFQLGLRRRNGDGYRFEILGRMADSHEEWTLYSRGQAILVKSLEHIDLPERPNDGWLHVDATRHYRLRTRAGIDYGPAFRHLEEVWFRAGESQARISQAPPANASAGNFVLHPAVLDSCFQAMQYAEREGHGFLQDDTCLPVSLERLSVYQDLPPDQAILCRVRLLHADATAGTTSYDVWLTDASGAVLAEVKGIVLQRVSASMEERSGELLFEPAWLPFEPAPVSTHHTFAGRFVLLFCDASGAGDVLSAAIHAQGGRTLLVRPTQTVAQPGNYTVDPTRRDDLLRLFTDLASRGEVPSDIVHLWSLDQPHFTGHEVETLLAAQSIGASFIPGLVQAITDCNLINPPRLWLVTSGAMVISDSATAPELAAAPLWGLGSVVAVEHPELRASMVDLSREATGDEVLSLLRLLQGNPDEDRFGLRREKTCVSRFVRQAREVAPDQVRPLQPPEEYRIEVPSPGVLDNLALRARKRTRPSPGEVLIEVSTAGMNFIDVTKAMGIYPGLDPRAPVLLGAECAGTIVAVGDGVSRFQSGDQVLAVSNSPSNSGLLASSVCLPQAFVFHKPGELSLEQAAGLPIAFLTAHYSLIELARIRAGEWILIPAGAGGVGLAAIQIAKSAGARVIATASSPEKQAYLRSIGVEHVLPSRTLDFTDEVLRITAGQGVDVVLNSLAGEYITKSLDVLKPFGRFIELGKRDIYQDRQIGLKVFRNNLSYHAVDVAALIEQRPEYVSELLGLLIGKINAGALKPLPTQPFSASEPALPFHTMAQGRHIGKVVVRMERDVSVLPPANARFFRKDATYLISGGMGGVGSTVAEWMAENGAGCLVLISRRPETAETLGIISRIESHGTRVHHAQTDIVDRAALEELLAMVREEMPAIAGVMHAATVIDDALIADLSPERFPFVMGPKVQGTWNLYAATAHDNLDFMVLFSSIAAVYPQPGHGSYAAANAFMDSFAQYAQSHGRNVASINWGGWDGIGLTRETGTARSVSGYGLQGFRAMAGPMALGALKRVMQTGAVQTIATPFDLDEAALFHGPQRVPPVLRTLLAEGNRLGKPKTDLSPVQEALATSASEAESLEILRAYLVGELSRVLKLAPERIGRDTLFGSIGLDSLMTLEFVRRMKTGLGIAIPTTAVYNHPTPALLAADIATRLKPSVPSNQAAPTIPNTVPMQEMAGTLVSNEISEDEALLALMQTAAN